MSADTYLLHRRDAFAFLVWLGTHGGDISCITILPEGHAIIPRGLLPIFHQFRYVQQGGVLRRRTDICLQEPLNACPQSAA